MSGHHPAVIPVPSRPDSRPLHVRRPDAHSARGSRRLARAPRPENRPRVTGFLGDLPANAEAHRWVPQMKILPHADVFVTAGGMGSTMEGLSHGVPLITVPQAADQFITGVQIDKLGLGKLIPATEVTAQALREAVLSVAGDPAMAGRLASMRTDIANSGGADAAADVIESRIAAIAEPEQTGADL
ncbi:nucleotide disphospho-sugar-binding domain-containing protein [Streptomyces sp. NPDC057555]|uniref:nucleotide disphospho-sugar-binding domain-containing protein n=1 Tax=Streptomyces sp. NPDC057555 TaxID=3346166 RepID=UPI0036AE748D